MKFKKIAFSAVVVATLILVVIAAIFISAKTADVLYVNGNIYTVDNNFSKASVMATKDDKIVYIGFDETAVSAAKIVDLGGKTVIPGIIEGHMHYMDLGKTAMQIDGFLKQKDEILGEVKQKADASSPGEWITGNGWNHEIWPEREWPTKEQLDAVAPDNPVMLNRVDYHAVWVNSKALEMANITDNTPNPQGGEILKNSGGELSGVLTDTAISFVSEIIPAMTESQKQQAYILAQNELLSYGITSLFDAGITFENIELLKKLYSDSTLKVRAYELLEASTDEDVKYIEAGNKPVMGLYNNRLSIAAVKLYADGSLGSRSALMLSEYSDRPGHIGNAWYTDDELIAIVKRVSDAGFQAATHAIGDGAVKQVITAYEKALGDKISSDHRFRIEHYQITTPEDIERTIKNGIIPAMQSTHATSDMGMAEDRIGPERIKNAYAWRTIIDAGGIIVGGSDAPVELVNPYHGMYASVTRADSLGNPTGGWYKELAMTRQEALMSFTIWAATGQFEEKIKGSLEVGKLADFVVLDRDLMTCSDADLRETKALLTVVGGEVLYILS